MLRSFDPDTYLTTGDLTAIKQGAASLAAWTHDDLGNRLSLTFANGASQAYGYDQVSRLSSLTNDLTGTAGDLARTFDHNPASQIVAATSSNDSYAYLKANQTQTATSDGLNRLATVNGSPPAYDARGNLTSDPSTGENYTYWQTNNQLRTTSGPSAVLSYDALDRLAIVDTNSADTKFAWDGAGAIAEYDGSDALQRRYVFDPATGRPLVWYEGTGTGATARRYLSADERGSVISVSDSAGASLAINAYDEYGMPSFGALADQRFGYTGQMWLSQAGLHQYLFRAYGQHLGRFSQADPIGYGGGPNLYAYVGGDPVNLVDPLGLQGCPGEPPNPALAYDGSGGGGNCPNDDIIVTAARIPEPDLDWQVTLASAQLKGNLLSTPVNFAKPNSQTKKPPSKAETCAAFRAAASDLRSGNTTYAVTAGAVSAYYFARNYAHAISFGRSVLIFLGGAGRGAAAGGEAGTAGGPWGAAAGALIGTVAGAALAYTEATGATTIGADAVNSLADVLGCPR